MRKNLSFLFVYSFLSCREVILRQNAFPGRYTKLRMIKNSLEFGVWHSKTFKSPSNNKTDDSKTCISVRRARFQKDKIKRVVPSCKFRSGSIPEPNDEDPTLPTPANLLTAPPAFRQSITSSYKYSSKADFILSTCFSEVSKQNSSCPITHCWHFSGFSCFVLSYFLE